MEEFLTNIPYIYRICIYRMLLICVTNMYVRFEQVWKKLVDDVEKRKDDRLAELSNYLRPRR